MRTFARPEGFEPSTPGAEIRYSIQLNYGRILLLTSHFCGGKQEHSDQRPRLKPGLQKYNYYTN